MLWGVQNGAVRDNVFDGTHESGQGVQIARRGYEYTSNSSTGSTCSGSGTTTAPVVASFPQYNEIYNNSCRNGQACINFSGTNFAGPGNNSWAQNNLIYGGSVVGNSGSGNTISNNTTNTSLNPGWADGSGNYSRISDFQPSANYSGGTSVSVTQDAVGIPWLPTWNLGAMHAP